MTGTGSFFQFLMRKIRRANTFLKAYVFLNPVLVFTFSSTLVSCGDNRFLLTSDGKPARLELRKAGDHAVRITLLPIEATRTKSFFESTINNDEGEPLVSLDELASPLQTTIGNLKISVKAEPLTIKVENGRGEVIQELVFQSDGKLQFRLDKNPVLGLGEGGPKVKGKWRDQKVEFDRNGKFHEMLPRWQADAYGTRNPVPLLVGTEGWGMFLAEPWSEVDLQGDTTGEFIPWSPPPAGWRHRNRYDSAMKGRPAAENYIAGKWDVFIFDASNPAEFLKDVSMITGKAVMPPKWAFGYMQSHRTLVDDEQMISIADTFRKKKLPIDAVIYLGTGFIPKGWNTQQPSLEFNPEVFKHRPGNVIAELHKRNVKVVMHVIPWGREKLPTLHGTIPPKKGEVVDASHIQSYWAQHVPLMNAGVDAFWPDEGDWFNLNEKIKRHQLYYQGPVSTKSLRPWSLHRNGYLGIAQWGGWVWSGDTESSWKTLEAQIANGINHSLSLSPFWGTDIGGFFPNEELTGELYARWFQFGAFNPSFRAHGKTWWTRLPWGWGLSDMGPLEHNKNPLKSSLNNPLIEPICKKYADLRYQMIPYIYTLAWQAREEGLPLIRSLWIHYPADPIARATGDEYLWGENLLIAPVYEKGATTRTVYLPAGAWYDWWTNEKMDGGKTIKKKVDLSVMPIYVKAGAIIPFDPVRQYTDEPGNLPLTIKIFTGKDGKFVWYEDDGKSPDYLNNHYQLTTLTWNNALRSLSIQPQGLFRTPARELIIQLVNEQLEKKIDYKNEKVVVAF